METVWVREAAHGQVVDVCAAAIRACLGGVIEVALGFYFVSEAGFFIGGECGVEVRVYGGG